MEHAPSERRPDAGLMPFYAQLVQQLARDGVGGTDGATAPVTEAQAVVMNHAIADVLRALAATRAPACPGCGWCSASCDRRYLGARRCCEHQMGEDGVDGAVRKTPMISSSLESGP